MSNKLLSIVLTAYNTESYLDECFQSIINQTYKNLEIILVDNGSTDKTGEIIDRYAAIDSRIRPIHKEHGPVETGWKTGILAATGEYLQIVDSDDYIDLDYCEQLVDSMADCDFVMADYKRVKNGKVSEQQEGMPKGYYRSKEKLELFYSKIFTGKNPYTGGMSAFPWNKLYKRRILQEVINELRYEDSVNFEHVMVYSYVPKCAAIGVTNINGYYYRQRGGSSSVVLKPHILNGFDAFYNCLLRIIDMYPNPEILRSGMQKWFFSHVMCTLGVHLCFLKENQFKHDVFPYINILANKRIALYGSGDVGKAYYSQIMKNHFCEISMWVSKSSGKEYKEGYNLRPVSALLEDSYDYVVIAVEKEKVGNEIKQELIDMGVDANKLLWRKPLELMDLCL